MLKSYQHLGIYILRQYSTASVSALWEYVYNNNNNGNIQKVNFVDTTWKESAAENNGIRRTTMAMGTGRDGDNAGEDDDDNED